MEKFYIMRNNQFIIYPGTVRECNITEEEKECKYCIRKPKTKCGHYNPEVDYPACNWFTFNNKWREIKEKDIMTYKGAYKIKKFYTMFTFSLFILLSYIGKKVRL